MKRPRDSAPAAPWRVSETGRRPVFVSLWASGPDTSLDGVFRIQALRPGEEGGPWEAFDRFCDPYREDGEDHGTATARMQREFGVTGADIDGCPGAQDVWTELLAFTGNAPVVVQDAESFAAWHGRFTSTLAGLPPCVGIIELAGLLLPGRLAGRREELVANLSALPLERRRPSEAAVSAEDVQSALTELLRRFFAGDGNAVSLAAHGYVEAWERLREQEPDAAERLALALELAEHPSRWVASAAGQLPLEAELKDGALSRAAADEHSHLAAVDGLQPLWTREAERWADLPKLSPQGDGGLAFAGADFACLDDIFRIHLPKSFVPPGGDLAGGYRRSQHDTALEVARTLGAERGDAPELMLMHAPTGTGKTLAYLVPAMLWARRNELRIGISTYTRALQEQAMDREVPRALTALRAADVRRPALVSMLKGRANYLCWRALKIAAPGAEDTGERWLAWTQLALFGSTDTDGDIDRFPQRPPLSLESSQLYRTEVSRLVANVRSQTGCCSLARDRETCAAEVARERAARSHVVITNHSFALARQDFFKHLIFDECEHLHDQAHAAWSHAITLKEARFLLTRLHTEGRWKARAVLDRLLPKVAEGSEVQERLLFGVERSELFAEALDELSRQVEAFLRWREQARRGRSERDEHSLLREFVEQPVGGPLIDARLNLARLGNDLDAVLAELAEHLDEIPTRGIARLRQDLERVRGDFTLWLEGLSAWIPLQEGRPVFGARTHNDAAVDPRGEVVLSARVLLPDEYLGSFYYPQLETGILLSAATWLRGGFEAASAYLGLDRAAQPGEEEERTPCALRTFRAPEVFDYARAVVCVPRDAPHPSHDKGAYLAYVREFISELGERTRGRMLVLFTNLQDTGRVGAELEGFFRARRIPLWYQGMQGIAKEELSELYRRRTNSILLGVDTFWYGADFPGETLEYLVIVRLPYGVPDRYHHAQCAALGVGEQRRRIYMPRALGKFRQGFGRLMRRESDRGCVFILDGRALEPRHRGFLKELPLSEELLGGHEGARLVRGDTTFCMREALAHMGMLEDVRRRGLPEPGERATGEPAREQQAPREFAPTEPEFIDVPVEDLPF